MYQPTRVIQNVYFANNAVTFDLHHYQHQPGSVQVLPYFQQLVQTVLPRVSSWLDLGNLLGVIQSFPYQTNNFNQISFNIFSFTIASLLGNRGTNYHHRRIQIQFLVASWWEKIAWHTGVKIFLPGWPPESTRCFVLWWRPRWGTKLWRPAPSYSREQVALAGNYHLKIFLVKGFPISKVDTYPTSVPYSLVRYETE